MQLELQTFNRVHLKPGRTGQKNLFPVGPDAPLEQRPYIQRPGGSPDDQDLKQKGLKGVGQGHEVKLTEVDNKYSSLGTSFKDFLADIFSDEYTYKSLDAESKKQQMEIFGEWLKARKQGKIQIYSSDFINLILYLS